MYLWISHTFSHLADVVNFVHYVHNGNCLVKVFSFATDVPEPLLFVSLDLLLLLCIMGDNHSVMNHKIVLICIFLCSF